MTAITEKLSICTVTAFGLVVALTPAVRTLTRRLNIVAPPCEESGHAEPTPVLGGVAIVVAVIAALGLVGELPVWTVAGMLTMLAVGALDDAVALTPSRKLLAQIAVVAFFLWAGPRAPEVTRWPLVNLGLAGFFMVAVINAFNLVDGLDGLAAGVGIAAMSAVGVVAWWSRDVALACAALAAGAALSGFLLFNFYPASIFMGDSGALPMGFLLGALALGGAALQQNSHLSIAVFPVLVMLVPLLDTAIVTVSRLATGNPISRRGLDHSHHRLLMLGLTVPRAVAVSWALAVTGALLAAGESLLSHPYVLSALPFVIAGIGVIGLFMVDLTFEGSAPGVAYGYLQGLARHILTLGYKRRLAEAVLDFALIPAAYFGACLLRRDFKLNDALLLSMMGTTPIFFAATYAAFALTGVYRGIWRYAGIADIIRFANGSLLAGVLVAIASMFIRLEVSGSVAVLYVVLLFNLLVFTRMSFQIQRRTLALFALPTERVLVVGAGRMGEAAVRYIFSGSDRRVRLVGFVDDDGFKDGKLVHGHQVLGSLDDLPRIYAATGFHRILIAADAISEDRLTMVKAFTDAHHMPLQRFLIEVNEFVPAIANGSSNGDGRGDGKSDNKTGNKSDSEIAATEAPPGSVVRPSIA
jgi:UDP-GlcNAc:undecaprenyl-phosphate/decaprenyl-phosphate GlcNAc-1-phosphate transferase